MAKRKREKPRRRRNPENFMADDRLGSKILFQAYLDDVEYTELVNPFGTIRISESAEALRLKDTRVFIGMMNSPLEIDEEKNDWIEQLIFYRKLVEEFPDEILLHTEIAKIYAQLDEGEKYQEKVLENFERFKGNPAVDMDYYYRQLKFGKEKEQFRIIDDVVSEENIHDAYPDIESFTPWEVIRYYALRVLDLTQKKQPGVEASLSLIKELDRKTYERMSMEITAIRRPIFFRMRSWGCLLMIILFVVGIIWGIVALVRWLI